MFMSGAQARGVEPRGRLVLQPEVKPQRHKGHEEEQSEFVTEAIDD